MSGAIRHPPWGICHRGESLLDRLVRDEGGASSEPLTHIRVVIGSRQFAFRLAIAGSQGRRRSFAGGLMGKMA